MPAQTDLFAEAELVPTDTVDATVASTVDVAEFHVADPYRSWGDIVVPDNPTADVTELLDQPLTAFDLDFVRNGTAFQAAHPGYNVAGALQWLRRWAAFRLEAAYDQQALAEGRKVKARKGRREPALPNLGLRTLNAILWGTPVYLEGERGIGKSASTTDLACAWGLKVGVVHLSQSTPESFAISFPAFGRDDNPVVRTKVVKGIRTIDLLILEEPNRAPQDVQVAAMEALSEKAIQGQRMPWLTVIAIMNPSGGDYATLETTDMAQLDRGSRYVVTAKDTGWDDHLVRVRGGGDAAMEKRVRDLIRTADRQDPEFADKLNARILDRFMDVALYNEAHPADAVPLDCVFGEDGTGNYFKFAKDADRVADKHGTVKQKIAKRHAQVVSALAKAFGTSYVTLEQVGNDLPRRALLGTIRNDWSMLWYAPQGAGKTSIVKGIVDRYGDEILATLPDGAAQDSLRVEAISLAQIAPQSEVHVVPIDNDLQFIVNERWTTPYYVALFDEYNRASADQHAEYMSATHPDERTLGGKSLPTTGVIALCNPATKGDGDATFEYDVQPLDPAIRERFTVTICTDVTMHGVDAHLMGLGQYGSVASTVVDWWAEQVLTMPAGDVYCSARTVERLMQHHLSGLPLHEALPQPPGMINPVRGLLPELRARLKGSNALTAEKLLTNPEWTVEQMDGDQDMQAEVADILITAPIPLMESNRDALITILVKMDRAYRENFIYLDHEVERQQYFIGLFGDVYAASSK